MVESGSAVAVLHIFSVLMDILSWPWALSSFNEVIMLLYIVSYYVYSYYVINNCFL